MVEFIDKQMAAKNASNDKGVSETPESLKLKQSIIIPGYTILSKLGERAASTVWQARQESLNRLVALKVFKKQYSDNQQNVDDFISEAKAVAKLKSPNLIQVYDIGHYNDTFYFVMEYIEGITLNHLLKTEGNLSQKKALTIAAAIASTLEEVWKKSKIFHCDIKPENIMLDNDGSIKVKNLGLAGIVNRHIDRSVDSNDIQEMQNYMSPEQLEKNTAVDYRSDMYSLGAMLYHMVTGHIPFIEKQQSDIAKAHKTEQLPSPSDIKPGITPGCCQIIARLMMKKPSFRFKDWSTVSRELSKLAEGKIVVTKIAASEVSMVARPGKVAAPEKSPRPLAVARKNKNSDSEKHKKYLKKKYSKKRAPTWLRIPLELLMLAWFGWLGYQLIWLPLNPIEPGVKIVSTPVESNEPEVDLQNTTENTTEPDSAVSDGDIKSETDLPIRPTPQPEPNIKKGSNVRVEPEKNIPTVSLPKLKSDIVDMLLKNNISGAVALLNESYPAVSRPSQVSELSDLLTKLKGNMVAKAFESHKGDKITIIYKGHQKKIKVTDVNGETVSADLYASTGISEESRAIKFKISQLDPQEQSHLLGRAHSPEIAVAKFLLYMNAGDYINARKLAEKCGTLSEACIAEVDAKIKMIMQ